MLYERIGGEKLTIGKFLFWHSPHQIPRLMDSDWLAPKLQPRGFFYGNLGPFPCSVVLPDCRYVCMVRDPRDVIVSYYFSVRDSHTPARMEDIEKQQRVRKLTLDEYVRLPEVQSDVLLFIDQALWVREQENVFFQTYEKALNDPVDFLASVSDLLGVSCPRSDLEEVVGRCLPQRADHLVVQDAEKTNRHRRDGRWGQFRKKLSKEAQDELWGVFGEKVESFGYTKDGLQTETL